MTDALTPRRVHLAIEYLEAHLEGKRRCCHDCKELAERHLAVVKVLAIEASRWRQFLGQARLRIIGSAGCDGAAAADAPKHFGLEVWNLFPGTTDLGTFEAQEFLVRYVDRETSRRPL